MVTVTTPEPQADHPNEQDPGQAPGQTSGQPPPAAGREGRGSRRRRLLWRAALAVVLLALAGLVGVCLTFNHFARVQVEEQTTRAINLRTTVASVAVRPWAGDVGFTDFRLGSPPGFATPDMVVVPSADVRVTYGQFRSDPVHITSITLVHPRLVIEADGGLNLNLKRMAERIPHHPHPVHLVIDEVTVQDATVVLRHLPGLPVETQVPVATFTLKNLGADKPEGAPIKEVVTRLVTTLAAHASDSPQMPPQYRALIKGDVVAVVRSVIPTEMGLLLLGMHGPSGPAGPSGAAPSATPSTLPSGKEPGREGRDPGEKPEKHHLLGGFSSLLGKARPTSRPGGGGQ